MIGHNTTELFVIAVYCSLNATIIMSDYKWGRNSNHPVTWACCDNACDLLYTLIKARQFMWIIPFLTNKKLNTLLSGLTYGVHKMFHISDNSRLVVE